MMPDALAKELRAGKLRAAYLLLGEEPLLRDDALAAIREQTLEPQTREFNFDRLEGASTSPAALLDALRTLPVLSPRRLVWLREPGDAKGRAAPLLDALSEAVVEVRGRSDLVLVVTAARGDRRERWVRAFAEPAALVACDPPKGRAPLLAFVRDEARRQGLSLEEGVAEVFAERIGPQLLVLRQEIAKAALLAAPARKLLRTHVEKSAIDIAEDPIWDLTDALGEGRSGQALAVLGKLLRSGTPEPVVLGSLAGHFRKLLRVRSGGTVAAAPFVVQKLEAQGRRYTTVRLVQHLSAIHATDEALKGRGGLPPALALERLVLSLSAP
ncbi:MAG TPA: DNA polymerase III subunit delta [Deltaproteobacteria bacterium]|jgi:DNA polymerase-3 subunit delta|nr:DNA polymerase III subunit delta [Deltaproteobacteria bacterium]